jgi:hypothetical protein
VVYDDTLDYDQRDDLFECIELLHALPAMEWICAYVDADTVGAVNASGADAGAGHRAHPSRAVIVRPWKETGMYIDEDLDFELRPLVIDSIGELSVKKVTCNIFVLHAAIK